MNRILGNISPELHGAMLDRRTKLGNEDTDLRS